MDYPIEELSQYQIEAVNKFNNNAEIEFEKVSCLNCDSENHKILMKSRKLQKSLKYGKVINQFY